MSTEDVILTNEELNEASGGETDGVFGLLHICKTCGDIELKTQFDIMMHESKGHKIESIPFYR